MNLKINRPKKEEIKEINELFAATITNNFREEGILIKQKEAADFEIETLRKSLERSFDKHKENDYYLIAKYQDKIIGTIAYGKVSRLICKNLKMDYTNTPEIRSAYILPVFQNKGVGSLLFDKTLMAMNNKGIKSFCLDCGYKKAQQFWKKKLGDPKHTMKNYWPNGNSHMIWYSEIKPI